MNYRSCARATRACRKGEGMKTVTLPVKGLNFAGCGREIEKRLGKLAPIRSVEASYVTQTVTITYELLQVMRWLTWGGWAMI